MKSSFYYAVIGMGALLVAGILLLDTHDHAQHFHAESTTAHTRAPAASAQLLATHTGLAIYTNGAYGFSLFYPATSTIATNFPTTQYAPVVEIAGVRIEASTDAQIVAQCDSPTPTEKMQTPSEVVFGGVAWRVFSAQGLTNYRTVHDDTCFMMQESSSSPAQSTVVGSFSFARP